MAAAISREKWLEKISHSNKPQKIKPVSTSIGVGEVKNTVLSDNLLIMLKELNDKIEAVNRQVVLLWDTRKYIWGEDLTEKVIHCDYLPIKNSLLVIYNGSIIHEGDEYLLMEQNIVLADDFNPEAPDKFVVHYNYAPTE